MSTKMKGLLKGLRYITQIFDEDKEPEMQIGNPTDVKHVSHIGWDGQSSADSPSWMEDYKSPQGSESVPVPVNGDSKSKENQENKRASEGSSRRSSRSQNPSTKDTPELPKSTRRHSSLEDGSSTAPGSPRQESTTKSRQSRRNTSDGSKAMRQPKGGSDSPSRNPPDIPKKSSRKKAKDPMGEGSTRSSRSKANNIPPVAYTSPFSDPGPNNVYAPGSSNGELTHSSSFRPLVKEGDKGCNGIA